MSGMAGRLSRVALWVLVGAVLLGLLAAVVSAIANPPDLSAGSDYRCDNPPCFGGPIPPGATPVMIAMFVVLALSVLTTVVALLLTLPALAVGFWRLIRGPRKAGLRAVLPFAGVMAVVVGNELLPHGVCAAIPVDFCGGRWHLLDHSLTGALPVTALVVVFARRS